VAWSRGIISCGLVWSWMQRSPARRHLLALWWWCSGQCPQLGPLAHRSFGTERKRRPHCAGTAAPSVRVSLCCRRCGRSCRCVCVARERAPAEVPRCVVHCVAGASACRVVSRLGTGVPQEETRFGVGCDGGPVNGRNLPPRSTEPQCSEETPSFVLPCLMQRSVRHCPGNHQPSLLRPCTVRPGFCAAAFRRLAGSRVFASPRARTCVRARARACGRVVRYIVRTRVDEDGGVPVLAVDRRNAPRCRSAGVQGRLTLCGVVSCRVVSSIFHELTIFGPLVMVFQSTPAATGPGAPEFRDGSHCLCRTISTLHH